MIDKEGKVTESDWENVDFSIFNGLQDCVDIEDLLDNLLDVCKRGGLQISREFLPLRQTLEILYGAGLIPFAVDDVENAFLNRVVTDLENRY